MRRCSLRSFSLLGKLALSVLFLAIVDAGLARAEHIPSPPTLIAPPNNAIDVPLTPTLRWSATDLDGDSLTYDVFVSTSSSPHIFPEFSTENLAATSYQLPALIKNAKYYWRVKVRDESTPGTWGPVWSFTTETPLDPILVSPANESIVRFDAGLQWRCEAFPITSDLYFGTDPSPPLLAAGLDGPRYSFDRLSVNTKYYWRIVTHNTQGASKSGPVWNFTTRGNWAPTTPSDPSPALNATGVLANSTLAWTSTDPDGDESYFDIYLGTTPTPPLVGHTRNYGDPIFHSYKPNELTSLTTYYWKVVVRDLYGGQTTGPTWSFTTREGSLPGGGDVTNNGILSVDDAACAMRIFVEQRQDGSPSSCGGLGERARADVNCDGNVTPRDARCIHKKAVDGSCSFCGGTAATTRVEMKLAPVVTNEAWLEWDTLVVRLSVSGVAPLQAFGFHSQQGPQMKLVRAVRLGVTSGVPSSLTVGANVGGYLLDQADATSTVHFMELRYFINRREPGVSSVTLSDFVDDLEGAADIVINENEVPVLFTSFNATPVAGGIDVRWELRSDEAIDSYTLYRYLGSSSLAEAVTKGRVTSTRGAYLDRGAQAGKTYRYELAVTTVDGDMFRSPMAMVTVPAMSLALYQNTPNPFNPQTTIRYDLPGSGSVRVRLWVMDVSGRLVRTLVDENQPGGSHQAVWNGTDDGGRGVASGVYFSVLDIDRERRTSKIVLLK